MEGMVKSDNPALQGKTVLITGGARGIGRAAATQLAALGARVVVLARDEKKAREELVCQVQAGALERPGAGRSGGKAPLGRERAVGGAIAVKITHLAIGPHSP
jgi:NAD(P)-dependent dehydrogenase (short-subunit alcohol dehydrogenase family)